MGKQYTREFKQEAVRLIESSGKSVLELARELGVNESALYRWRRQYAVAAESKAEVGELNPQEAAVELKRLRRELEVVKQERDILKKAISIFSQEKP